MNTIAPEKKSHDVPAAAAAFEKIMRALKPLDPQERAQALKAAATLLGIDLEDR